MTYFIFTYEQHKKGCLIKCGEQVYKTETFEEAESLFQKDYPSKKITITKITKKEFE